MDRRSFLLAAAALAAACARDESSPRGESGGSNAGGGDGDAVTATGGAAKEARAGEGAPLGLQLYTVRDLMAEDVAATLALVAAVGYREVEFAGYFDHSPEEVRRLLADAGLAAPSAHVGYEQFAESVDAVIEHASAVGHEFVVVPAMPEHQRRTTDDYRRHAENFDRWAEACAAAGLKFGYHNHTFEFEETEGEIPYDLLLAETDPARVLMELDLAWARGGNADALAYFEAWPGRFPLCHIKDYGDGEDVDIDKGDVNFERIFQAASTAGLKHGFVERDNAADPRASIRANFEAISPLWQRYL
ncbi:MAG TPA: TIM barrel protein [Sphingomicrobium sp.]|nr:TIM barrel protein [Sphingomicrobium sp.]